jgi:hypothetical protein
MSVYVFTQKLEKTFWATVIPLMSESTIVQVAILKIYKLLEVIRKLNGIKPMLLFSILCLYIGFVIGIISGLM